MSGRKVEDALAPFRSELGTIPDQQIAEKAKVSRSVVVNYRKRLGIKAYEGYKFGVRDAVPPSTPRAPRAQASRASSADTGGSKTFRGRRSKLDAWVHLLGREPDSEVARKAGVTQENVRTYRLRRGIAAHVAGPARAAAPETPLSGRLVFSVQLETPDGAKTYAVVAAGIGDAATLVAERGGHRYGKVSVKSVSYVAEMI